MAKRAPTSVNDRTDDPRETMLKAWGGRIRRLRVRLGKTQREFGKALSLDPDGDGYQETSVARWETGSVAPSGDAVFRMLDLARSIGAVWEFTGAGLRKIYEAMLKDDRLLHEVGDDILVFLKADIGDPRTFIDVLNTVAGHGARFFRMGSPGKSEQAESLEPDERPDSNRDIAHAYVLFSLPDIPTVKALEQKLLADKRDKRIINFKIDIRSKDALTFSEH